MSQGFEPNFQFKNECYGNVLFHQTLWAGDALPGLIR